MNSVSIRRYAELTGFSEHTIRYWIRNQQTHVRRRTGPYPWRHTFISHLLSTGKVSIEEVARWAGNSPGMISKHYGRYMPRQATEDRHAAIIEEALTPQVEQDEEKESE